MHITPVDDSNSQNDIWILEEAFKRESHVNLVRSYMVNTFEILGFVL